MSEPSTSSSSQSPDERHERQGRERLIMLSDGVFAIAITLLALEIRPEGTGLRSLKELVVALGPKLVSYAVSVFVISTFWFSQRRAFARFERVDGVLSGLTLAYLALVAAIPAATTMLYTQADNASIPFYLSLIAMIAGIQSAAWGYGAFVARLVAPELDLNARLFVLATTAIAPPVMSGLAFFSLTHRGLASWAGWAALWTLSLGLGLARRQIVRNRPSAQ